MRPFPLFRKAGLVATTGAFQAVRSELTDTKSKGQALSVLLLAQKFPPRSVVVEHNGAAVAPSEFSTRQLNAGDRLEIVRIVAGG